MDEAHKLKSHETFSFHLVKKLESPVILFTATPMINKPIDLHWILALIWKPEWARFNGDAISVDDYRQADAQIQTTTTAEKLDHKVGEFAWVLDLASYYTRAGSHGQNQMPASAEKVYSGSRSSR